MLRCCGKEQVKVPPGVRAKELLAEVSEVARMLNALRVKIEENVA